MNYSTADYLESLQDDLETINTALSLQSGTKFTDIATMAQNGTITTGGGSGRDWSLIGYSEEPKSIAIDFNYAKSIYDNWVGASDLSYLYANDNNLVYMPLVDTSSAKKLNYMFSNAYFLEEVPLLNTSGVTHFNYMFTECKGLKKVPIFNTSSALNIVSMFDQCPRLTDESLDNILQMCININPSYAKTKTLAYAGISSTYYTSAQIQALPHYQDFVSAGWSIGF